MRLIIYDGMLINMVFSPDDCTHSQFIYRIVFVLKNLTFDDVNETVMHFDYSIPLGIKSDKHDRQKYNYWERK